jgi:YbbR domain-containing protein
MKNIILNNLELKILSLGLAVFLWFFISTRGTSEISIEVPIELINIPTGYEVVKKERERVNVSIFGSEGILRSMKPDDLRVIIDIKDSTPGINSFTIRGNHIRVPPAITVSDVTPSEVRIRIEKTTKKEVPIVPHISDSSRIKPGFSLHVRPDKVFIEGPESIVKRVSSLKTEPIDVQ